MHRRTVDDNGRIIADYGISWRKSNGFYYRYMDYYIYHDGRYWIFGKKSPSNTVIYTGHSARECMILADIWLVQNT